LIQILFFPGLDSTTNQRFSFRSSEIELDNPRSLINSRDHFVVSESVFPAPLEDKAKQSQRIEFVLRMRETNREVRVSAPAYAPIGGIAEYLIKELFPHVMHQSYEWTLVQGNNSLSPRHTLITTGIEDGDVLTLKGTPNIITWAPNIVSSVPSEWLRKNLSNSDENQQSSEED
jgi:hypothetical protein